MAPSRRRQRQGMPGAAPRRGQPRPTGLAGEVGGAIQALFWTHRRVFEPQPSNEVLVYSPILANSSAWGRVLAGSHARYPSSTRLTAC